MSLTQLEAQLLAAGEAVEPAPIFILGSPRTGSTVLYEAMVAALGAPYISNLTNEHFAETPIIGMAISRAYARAPAFESQYGKIAGPHAPSEGSLVVGRWCGGGNPSEITSPGVLTHMEAHMRATLSAAEAAWGAPVIIKNAWNCFRVAALSAAFPRARFIWIRRDIAAAAHSDLAARYKTKGDPNAWNSATPRNIDDLKRLPHWAQVVENQAEFARAISAPLERLDPSRQATIWYEDFTAAPVKVLGALIAHLSIAGSVAPLPADKIAAPSNAPPLPADDAQRLTAYVESQGARLAAHAYRPDAR